MTLQSMKLILTLALLISTQAQAAKFANQFTEFELPVGWTCSLEGAEWVCQSTNDKKKKEAIIVLAAKLKGDQDSIDQYLTYLKGVKTFTSVAGKPMKSEPKYAKTVKLNEHPWVDSLHLESEIPGFFTRYLATIKDDIGVLVTYSISKAKYQDYVQSFETLVRTLKVFRKPGGINVGQGGNLMNANIPQHLADTTVFPGANQVDVQGAGEAAPVQPKANDDWMMYAGIAAVVILLIIIKKKKKS